MADLKIIVGLGNPGPQYARNRHNLGFQVIDILARRHAIDLSRSQNKARFGDGWISRRRVPDPANPFGGLAERQKVLLVKPITYMNNSGEAVGPLLRYFDVGVENLLVIHDDLDLASAKLRLRPGGSSGGQNGIKSIIQHLGGAQEFARMRMGIGRPPGRMNPADYVLQNFNPAEEDEFGPLRETAADAVECWLFEGIEVAMNKFNG
ncbi:MAG: aminoacyl-tRNA hydrolase [Caldilineaceae bacterium]|nr:aminoacyl-tRNA hydrolase [Caldilineaceae bacterium]HRJ41234.1 aminoacyl-tRNA hydrolase [Caldilineaceae bacterium]